MKVMCTDNVYHLQMNFAVLSYLLSGVGKLLPPLTFRHNTRKIIKPVIVKDGSI